jgi:outer membrane protein
MIEVSGTHSNQSLHKRATAGGVLMSRFASVAIIAAALVAPATMAQSVDNGSQGQSEAAQAMIEEEFNQRNERLQEDIADFREKVQQFEKDAPVLAESDRSRRQRELGNLDADLQRKQREIQEDFNRRRNEEFAIIIERANAAIMSIAEEENYDLILQDAVTVSDRIDITDKVITVLESN